MSNNDFTTNIHKVIYLNYKQFLRVAFKGRGYEYMTLPFSLSLGPFTFTKCVRVH